MTKVKVKKILQYNESIKLLDKYFLESEKSEYFQKYRLSFLFFSLYQQVMAISNKEIIENGIL